jgi:cobalt-zinc-cadmium resistance protein CzcA
MPSDFLPELNEGDFVYTVVTSDGNSISKTEEIIQELEKQIINEKEIDKIYSRIGISQSGIDLMPQNSGDIFVILKKDYKENAKNIAKNFITKLQSKCLECEITETQPIKMRFNEMLEGSRADLSLKIFGEDLMQLITITDNIKNLLKEKFDVKNNGYLKEIDKDFINSIKLGHYVDVLPNYQQIARHQIAIANVNNDLKDAMAGIKVGNFYATEFPIPIIMHLNEKNRNDIKAIANIPVGLADGGSFALDQVAKIKESDDISSIPRLFGKRYSGLSIYLTNTQYQKFIDEASKEIKANKLLPDGYVIEWGGRFKNLNSAKKQIMLAIPIIALLIFAILYQMFKDLRKILVMFSAIPFALSGSIILLYICQIPITVSVYVGFIALIGISLLNSIILIDTQNQSLDIETACLTRLRPIVMTAVVASLGFLPMAFGNGIGAEVQQPIAIAVIGGIVSSTISTLILSPILLKRFLVKK